jgi:mannosyltransferase
VTAVSLKTESVEASVPRRRPRRDHLLVAALVVVALLLRLPFLGRAYWIDEAISIGISSRPLSRLPSVLHLDGSPPFYYLLLHFWIGWFGASEVATHSFSLLLSLIAVPAGYWAGRELFDRRAGLAVAALMATNPFLNWYATETRMYTLIVLLSLLAVTFAWKAARDRSWRDAVAATVVFDALLYTHDWCLYLAAGTGLVLLWHARTRRDRTLALWILAGGGLTLALWAPWIPEFLDQASHTAAPWAVQPGLGDFFADPSTALGGTIGVVVVPLFALGAWLCRKQPPARTAGVIAAVSFLATVLGFLGSELQPSWTVRYLAILVAPYLLAAGGLLSSTKAGRSILWAACLVLSAWSVLGSFLPNPHGGAAKDNMAAVAAAVSARMAPGDVVVVTQTEQTPVAVHYLPSGLRYLTPTGPVTDPTVVDWRDIVARLDAASPCADVGPAIDRLPVGAKVLEIDPYHHRTAAGSPWSAAVGRQVQQVDSFLRRDGALTAIGSFDPAVSPKPYAPVSAVLYEKTAASPSCPA